MTTPDTTKEEVFAKIGRLCMVWASLDRSANMLLTEILGVSEDQSACVATQLDPLASRMRLLKTLTYTTSRSDEWKASLVELLNYIEGHLCAKRNRIVHDGWDFKGTEPAQLDRRAKVMRAQSRQPLALSTVARSTVTAAHVDLVIKSAANCSVALLSAWTDLVAEREDGPPRSGFSVLELAMRDVIPQHRLDRKSGQSVPDQAPV